MTIPTILASMFVIFLGISPAIGAGPVIGTSATMLVSGVGAQASAHGIDPAGLVTDVLVAFSGQSQSAPPTLIVFLTKTDPSTGEIVFDGSGSTSNFFNATGSGQNSTKLSAMVKVIAFVDDENPSAWDVSLNVAWIVTAGTENVSAHDSYSQPGYSMNQALTGALNRTTVSGDITVGGEPIPISENATPAIWNTSNQGMIKSASPIQPAIRPSNRKTRALADTTSASDTSSGYWTGYWTWNGTEWVWTWVWVSDTQGYVVS